MRTVMAYLGNVIYWIANCIAVAFGLMGCFQLTISLYYWQVAPHGMDSALFILALALIVWLIGRSAKFVLSWRRKISN